MKKLGSKNLSQILLHYQPPSTTNENWRLRWAPADEEIVELLIEMISQKTNPHRQLFLFLIDKKVIIISLFVLNQMTIILDLYFRKNSLQIYHNKCNFLTHNFELGTF